MASPLIGVVRPNGRVQFAKDDNPRVFKSIQKSGNSVARIKVIPGQQAVQLTASDESETPWFEEFNRLVQTADSIFLTFHGSTLKFASAMHSISPSQKCYTFGTASEASRFSSDRWVNAQYFYGRRFDDFRFNMTRLVTYRAGKSVSGGKVEMLIRIESIEGVGDSLLVFDATGSASPIEVVEWRGSVDVGKSGRFYCEDKRIALQFQRLERPFTILEEYREEFKNYAYVFEPERFAPILSRHVKRKLAEDRDTASA